MLRRKKRNERDGSRYMRLVFLWLYVQLGHKRLTFWVMIWMVYYRVVRKMEFSGDMSFEEKIRHLWKRGMG